MSLVTDTYRDWGCSSVVERLRSIAEALGAALYTGDWGTGKRDGESTKYQRQEKITGVGCILPSNRTSHPSGRGASCGWRQSPKLQVIPTSNAALKSTRMNSTIVPLHNPSLAEHWIWPGKQEIELNPFPKDLSVEKIKQVLMKTRGCNED